MCNSSNNIPAILAPTGELTFATTSNLYKKGYHLIANNPLTIFDLQYITTSDNSGIALLVAWAHCAKALKKSLKFINPPTQLISMLKLTNLQTLLPIEMEGEKF